MGRDGVLTVSGTSADSGAGRRFFSIFVRDFGGFVDGSVGRVGDGEGAFGFGFAGFWVAGDGETAGGFELAGVGVDGGFTVAIGVVDEDELLTGVEVKVVGAGALDF